MKKLFLFFISFFPLMASADDKGSCGDNVSYYYEEATHTLTISGEGAMRDHGRYLNWPYPWSSYKDDIVKIVIESGVTTIGSAAFSYCNSLTSVVISSSVTFIDESAFCGCI